MKELKVIDYLAVVILIPCVGFTTGQSTSILPTPSIQQTVVSQNQTSTLNASLPSMTVQSNYSTTILQYQTSSVEPSSAVTENPHSSVVSTPRTTTTRNDEEEDKEEKEKKKKETAIIAASCSGGALLIMGLILVIFTHRKDQKI